MICSFSSYILPFFRRMNWISYDKIIRTKGPVITINTVSSNSKIKPKYACVIYSNFIFTSDRGGKT